MDGMSLRRRDLLIATGLCIVVRGAAAAQPSLARRLKLKNANTGESFEGYYRDESGPIPGAMADLAAFLRDHRANKIGPVDVATLDFLALNLMPVVPDLIEVERTPRDTGHH